MLFMAISGDRGLSQDYFYMIIYSQIFIRETSCYTSNLIIHNYAKAN